MTPSPKSSLESEREIRLANALTWVYSRKRHRRFLETSGEPSRLFQRLLSSMLFLFGCIALYGILNEFL